MAGGWFWTNRVVNPVLRRVLRGRLGRRWGRHLAVLRYTGRRTGRAHELVCQYVRTAATVWVLVGRPESKTWWRNLRSPADVDLWLAGERARARAGAVVGDEQPDEARRGLATYLAGMPRAARAIGLTDPPDPAALAAKAQYVVLVRAELAAEPTASA
jgi:F420H(2)-dependent quinone reductase